MQDAPIPTDASSITVVCPSWVGDTVMCTPVLRALRAGRPGARIAALARPGLGEVLAGAPWLDEVVTVKMKGALGPLRVSRALRTLDTEVALLLPNSFRSALGARFGAARRIGYDRDGRGVLLTHALPVERSDEPVPTVDYYARLGAFALGEETIDPTLALATTPGEEAAADRLLEGVEGVFVLLNPGAKKTPKRWPATQFTRLAEVIVERLGAAVVLTGGPSERPLLEEVATGARTPLVNLAARGVTLGSLKAVVRRSAALVTNDTGPRHLAAALGTPTVTLYGPTDHRWTTLHGAIEHHLLAEPFLPTTEVADRHPKTCAIDRITVGDALFALRCVIGGAAHREPVS